MNYTNVQLALDATLATVVDASLLQNENTARTGKTQDFVRSTLLPAQTEIASLGVDGYDRVNGLYQIDVFVRIDSGTTAVNTQVDTILAAFVKGNYLSNASVQVQIENKWRLSARVVQNFYQVPIMVQWSSYQN